jgi:hypothetical protein
MGGIYDGVLTCKRVRQPGAQREAQSNVGKPRSGLGKGEGDQLSMSLCGRMGVYKAHQYVIQGVERGREDFGGKIKSVNNEGWGELISFRPVLAGKAC